jgi:hypothetical protein
MLAREARMALHRLAVAAAAVLAAPGCAMLSGARNDVVAGFCGVRPAEAWSRIEAPADAETLRQLALADLQFADRRPRGDEYWFAKADGEIRFCITPLERASYVPARNRSRCDERIGVWWNFRRTESGPATDGPEEEICVT